MLGTLSMTLPGIGHDVGLCILQLFKIVLGATLCWARPLGVHYPCIEVKIGMSIHPLDEKMDVLWDLIECLLVQCGKT